MSLTPLGPLFGWAALLSAVATVATLVTGILFFTAGGRFGKANDAASVVQMLLMMPVAVALYLLRPVDATGWALLVFILGCLGMVVAAVLQALLVLERVAYEQTFGAVLAAGGVIGLWLILVNILALGGAILPASLVAFGIAAGVGYLLVAIGFYRGGQGYPLFYVGSLLVVVGYVVWGTWLGILLQVGRLGL